MRKGLQHYMGYWYIKRGVALLIHHKLWSITLINSRVCVKSMEAAHSVSQSCVYSIVVNVMYYLEVRTIPLIWLNVLLCTWSWFFRGHRGAGKLRRLWRSIVCYCLCIWPLVSVVECVCVATKYAYQTLTASDQKQPNSIVTLSVFGFLLSKTRYSHSTAPLLRKVRLFSPASKNIKENKIFSPG